MNTVFCCLLSVATPVVTPDNIRQMLISRNTKYGHLIVISVLTMLTGEIFITSSQLTRPCPTMQSSPQSAHPLLTINMFCEQTNVGPFVQPPLSGIRRSSSGGLESGEELLLLFLGRQCKDHN